MNEEEVKRPTRGGKPRSSSLRKRMRPTLTKDTGTIFFVDKAIKKDKMQSCRGNKNHKETQEASGCGRSLAPSCAEGLKFCAVFGR